MGTDAKQTVLVIVHPGSACGSASYTLGYRVAQEYRERIARNLDRHAGDTLVLDGFLSDELPEHPVLEQAIQRAVARTKYSMRQYACDADGVHFTVLLPEIIRASAWNDPDRFRFDLTGAWYFADDRSGCVNGVRTVLREMGFEVAVLVSAMPDPDGNEVDEDEESYSES